MPSAFVFNAFRMALLDNRGVDLASDDLRVLLVGKSYKPDRFEQTTRADIKGEVDAPGYRAGGKKLEGRQVKDGALYAEPVIWDECEIAAVGCVVYCFGGHSPGRDVLIAYLPFPQERAADGDRFVLTWKNGVVLKLE